MKRGGAGGDVRLQDEEEYKLFFTAASQVTRKSACEGELLLSFSFNSRVFHVLSFLDKQRQYGDGKLTANKKINFNLIGTN